jgi:molybdopterin molybdotransferase
MSLLAVSDVLAALANRALPVAEIEVLPIREAAGRILAHPAIAERTHPPFTASAMDGYAVRTCDAHAGAALRVVGESAAGRRFGGAFGAGDAVRIFTGAPVPEGADAILIQENAERSGNTVIVNEAPFAGRFLRRAGLDFASGETVMAAGRRIAPRDVALLAGLGPAKIGVSRKPRVAILPTGDELVEPGGALADGQIIATNHLAVAALVEAAGGIALPIGPVADRQTALVAAFRAARATEADLLVTIGGASVGEHDLVQPALAAEGATIDFWKIAMRPGKPMMFGFLPPMLALGLPGNPASAFVCARLFLVPVVRALGGETGAWDDPSLACRSATLLAANDMRQDYLRARLIGEGDDGLPLVDANPRQDSSLTRVLSDADGLLIRQPHAPALEAGERARWIPF